ncbi:MAG: hypothetical protein LBR74_01125 [Eubacterium sp.]|jgi:hypothetical protein|nr:hypothetical protein [Eubacterium sp.]
MNLIICNENCNNQRDGYCQMEGSALITNALASPCCYFKAASSYKNPEDKTRNDGDVL